MGRARPEDATRRAWSFAPGHVTGYFSPDLSARDPRGRGSLGAGVVLEAGVHCDAAYTPGPRRLLRVRGSTDAPLPISVDVARRLLGDRTGRLTVTLRHALPIGQGFGMSAAGALATGLGVAQVLDVDRDRAIEIAHLAELYGGGGLGGVAAILGGGTELRVRPGVPPWGDVVHRTVRAELLVGAVGEEIPSPPRLLDPKFRARVTAAFQEVAPTIRRAPTLPELFDQAEPFTDALDLGRAATRRLIQALRATGVRCAQGMLGASFFAWAPTKISGQRAEALLASRSLPYRRLRPEPIGAQVAESLLEAGQVAANP